MDKFTKKTGMEAAMAQAAAIPEIQLENMKEFFAMWTNISVDCFQQCMPAVDSKDKAAEMTCIRNCAARHVEANHRIVQQFTLQNDEFTEKKQSENKNLNFFQIENYRIRRWQNERIHGQGHLRSRNDAASTDKTKDARRNGTRNSKKP